MGNCEWGLKCPHAEIIGCGGDTIKINGRKPREIWVLNEYRKYPSPFNKFLPPFLPGLEPQKMQIFQSAYGCKGGALHNAVLGASPKWASEILHIVNNTAIEVIDERSNLV